MFLRTPCRECGQPTFIWVAKWNGGICRGCLRARRYQVYAGKDGSTVVVERSRRVTPDDRIREIGRRAMERPDLEGLNDKDKAALTEMLGEVESLGDAAAGSDAYVMVHLMILGKLGRFAEGLSQAQAFYARSPSWPNAVALANMHRRSGDAESAIKAFELASTHDPKDVTAHLEVGDIRLEQGRYKESIEAYQRALDVEEDNSWALPSVYFCRHMLGEEGRWLDSLIELAEQEGCTCGMDDCLSKILGGYSAERGKQRAIYLTQKLDRQEGTEHCAN